jgi:hypothetical protein
MPKYKNIAASLIGLVRGCGERAERATVRPREAFEADPSEVEHHIARGRVKELSENEFAQHVLARGNVLAAGSWQA